MPPLPSVSYAYVCRHCEMYLLFVLHLVTPDVMLQAVKLSEIVELAKTVAVDVQFELPI